MSNTITIRLPEELAEWLAEISRTTGMPVGRIIREQLQRAKEDQHSKPYLKLAGKIKGPPDLSMRKGFSRR